MVSLFFSQLLQFYCAMVVVIAIIAILAGMLMPALQRARAKGQSASCKNNYKSISNALQGYLNDWNSYLPGPTARNVPMSSSSRHNFTYALNTYYLDTNKKASSIIELGPKYAPVWYCPGNGQEIYETEKQKKYGTPCIGVLNNGSKYGYPFGYTQGGGKEDTKPRKITVFDNVKDDAGNRVPYSQIPVFTPLNKYTTISSGKPQRPYEPAHAGEYNLFYLDGHVEGLTTELEWWDR